MQAYIADELLFRHWTDYKGEKESYLVLFDIKENKYQAITSSDVLSGTYMLGGGPNMLSHRIAGFWLMFLHLKKTLQTPPTQIFI